MIFDKIVVQNTHGIALLLQGGTSGSGVRDSRFLHIGNHWRNTLNSKDRIQGVVFCCGAENSDNFATGNYFSDIGLDALQFSNQKKFTAANNIFKLENEEHALIQAPDFPAAIFPMYSTNSIITGNRISGAQGCGIDAPGLRDSVISDNTISDSNACGIGVFLGYDKATQSENVAIVRNTITNSVRWKQSPFKGAITIFQGSPTGITITGNNITDTQAAKTQRFGVQVMRGTNLSRLKIDADNSLEGNGEAAVKREDIAP